MKIYRARPGALAPVLLAESAADMRAAAQRLKAATSRMEQLCRELEREFGSLSRFPQGRGRRASPGSQE